MMAFAVGIVITCMNIGNVSKKRSSAGGSFGGFGSKRGGGGGFGRRK